MRDSYKGFWTALLVTAIPLTAVAWILSPDVGNVRLDRFSAPSDLDPYLLEVGFDIS